MPAQRGDFAEPVLQRAQSVLEGASGTNPAVESVAKYVQRALGDNASPARLYEVRKVLAGKLSGRAAIGDELGAAVKGAQAETTRMIDAIDNALAGGAREGSTWGEHLGDYAALSKPITSGRALRTAADELADKPLLGDTPQITAAGYQRAIDKASASNRFGDRLTPQARTEADAFLQRLKEAEAASRTRKLAMTGGGGSNTAGDLLLAGADTVVPVSAPPCRWRARSAGYPATARSSRWRGCCRTRRRWPTSWLACLPLSANSSCAV